MSQKSNIRPEERVKIILEFLIYIYLIKKYRKKLSH